MVLFLDSVNFKRSEYCLFEGGAYWATRTIEDCIHLHFDASWIPDYIKFRLPKNHMNYIKAIDCSPEIIFDDFIVIRENSIRLNW